MRAQNTEHSKRQGDWAVPKREGASEEGGDQEAGATRGGVAGVVETQMGKRGPRVSFQILRICAAHRFEISLKSGDWSLLARFQL